jgi:hypothetical protein
MLVCGVLREEPKPETALLRRMGGFGRHDTGAARVKEGGGAAL